MKKKLSYPDAMKAAQTGSLVGRQNLIDKGAFVCAVPSRQISATELATSNLPDAAKTYFDKKFKAINAKPDHKVDVAPFLCMKTRDHVLIYHWQPSAEDMAATDWCIVEPKDMDKLVAAQ